MPTPPASGFTPTTFEIICCPECGSLAVFRRSSRGERAHWRCRDCTARWSEPIAAGRSKECNAKLVDANAFVGEHTRGQSRRDAVLRACTECGSNRVRPTTNKGCVTYWYCQACSHGWSELLRPEGWGDCNVKLAAPLVQVTFSVFETAPMVHRQAC